MMDLVTASASVSVDLFLVQDLSHSYGPHLQYIKEEIPELVTFLASDYKDSRFGFASFVDKPMAPFGYIQSEDYCYMQHVPLSEVHNETFMEDGVAVVRGILRNGDEEVDMKEKLDELSTYSGRDTKENQLGAVLHALLSEETGWKKDDNHIRLIALATDDKFHVSGDGDLLGLLKDDTKYSEPSAAWCLLNDYPSIHSIKQAIEKTGTKIMFLVTSNVYHDYSALLHQIGPDNGMLVNLNERSQYIAEAIKHGVETLVADSKQSFGEGAAHALNILNMNEKNAVIDDEDAEEEGIFYARASRGFSLKPSILNSTPLIGCPPNTVFEVMYIQDASASYDDDIENIKSKVPKTMEDILDQYQGSKVGFSAFVDKPILPFGFEKSGDYCSIIFTGLTDDVTKIVMKMEELKIRSGNDPYEAQLHAIVHNCWSKRTGWTIPSWTHDQKRVIRIAAMVTDSGFHTAGESSLPKHDGKSVGCKTHDYPSVNQAANALKSKRVFPLFLTTPEVEGVYEKLLTEMDINGAVQLIDEKSSNIGDALLAGLETICGYRYLFDDEGHSGTAAPEVTEEEFEMM